MVRDGNQADYDDHFIVCKNIKLLCGTPETNIMVYTNCASILFKMRKCKQNETKPKEE